MYSTIYATGWYRSTPTEVLNLLGQYSEMVWNNYHLAWDYRDQRYYVKAKG